MSAAKALKPCRHDPAGYEISTQNGDVWCFRCKPARCISKENRVEMTDEQKRQVRKLWFLYGNYGDRHSDEGHKFLQRLLDASRDERRYYRPPKEVTELVDAILRGETVSLPAKTDVSDWVAWETEREVETLDGYRVRKTRSMIHRTDSTQSLYCLCGVFIDPGLDGAIRYDGKAVMGRFEHKCSRCFPKEK
jgi:hypothetical protein